MTYRLNMLRWRLARWIAPNPIVAAPTGDAKTYLYLRLADEKWPYHATTAWIEASSLQLEMGQSLRPLSDEFGLATTYGPRGTFSGTIGEPASA